MATNIFEDVSEDFTWTNVKDEPILDIDFNVADVEEWLTKLEPDDEQAISNLFSGDIFQIDDDQENELELDLSTSSELLSDVTSNQALFEPLNFGNPMSSQEMKMEIPEEIGLDTRDQKWTVKAEPTLLAVNDEQIKPKPTTSKRRRQTKTTKNPVETSVKGKGVRKHRIRYNKEQYNCDICSYSCTVQASIFHHVKQHWNQGDNVPKFSCEICGKDEYIKEHLLVHKSDHIDGNQYCCDLCDFRTVQLKKLIQHRRKHTGERPHRCPFCSYKSSRRDNLHSHTRRVHNIPKISIDTFTPPHIIYPTPSQV
ncbi:zinc finger protein 184-like isoform X2 [Cimex lectularius]|uniref:C2H2-type domain-containing protein n=1 Tax=Cimex lectularius TaxID=79782 RepID=A0A8I6R8Z0_CIMLE|nr:zinc finger protein 184-like isoform X2 [Cimex lectularius]